MTTYYPYGVKLSEGQRKKLAKAYRENSAITIRLSSDELHGGDQLMLTKTQIARLIKAKRKVTDQTSKYLKHRSERLL